jgi:hypothetical protein
MFDPTPYAFVDTETGGLDQRRDMPWEVAIIRWQPSVNAWNSWLIHITDFPAGTMTKEADEVGGFTERFGKEPLAIGYSTRAARIVISNILRGARFVGSKPTFDQDMLLNLGCEETWHHRSHNVPSVVMGQEGVDYGGLQDTAVRLGWDVDAPEYAPHTAMGDATLARDIFMAVMETDRG